MQVRAFEVTVGDRIEVGGLGVYPLIGVSTDTRPHLTGPEAFAAGMIEVSELDPPEVPSLAVTNLAGDPILLVEGEMLLGGDQNRTMNVTVLCPPEARIVVPVSCVEAGRWGARRSVLASNRHAPASMRAAKIATLGPRTDDRANRRSDQGLIWEEVERQSRNHAVHSRTSALEDVAEELDVRMAGRLAELATQPGQIGVVCTYGSQVLGLDLFDRPSTLGQYLRAIVAGYALDAPLTSTSFDAIGPIEHFLGQVDGAPVNSGQGVGLGDELLFGGAVAGIGLRYEDRLVHLAAFPAPA
jgi:hypothetical protein